MSTRRVAVIGMLRSGKTTLVTALIDHWLNHDKNRMPLRNGKEIICQWKDPNAPGKREFDRNRQRFSEQDWPVKTLKLMRYALRWSFLGDYFKRDIKLLDLPGERLADADMIFCKDLASWSSHIVHLFEMDPITQKPFEQFSNLFKKKPPVFDDSSWLHELEIAYRKSLQR